MKQWVVGLDLGGTQIRAIRTNLEGEKFARTKRLTEAAQGPRHVIRRILQTIDDVCEGIPQEDVLGIGIGAPGPITTEGVIYDPPNLPGWTPDISLVDEVQDHFKVPTYAGNDANLGALGEHRFGAGIGVSDLIYITISTGIGGGIISGGRLLLGARGFAAEVGHQVLEPKNPPGRRSLEQLASGTALGRDAREALRGGAKSSMVEMAGDIEAVSARVVADAAAQGDTLALQLLQRAGKYIGIGFVNLIHILEPSLILVGGGVSQAGDLLLNPIREAINENLLSKVYQATDIQLAGLGPDVGLLGAIALVLAKHETS